MFPPPMYDHVNSNGRVGTVATNPLANPLINPLTNPLAVLWCPGFRVHNIVR